MSVFGKVVTVEEGGEIFRNIFLMGFKGPAADFQKFRIAPETFDDVVRDVAVAAVDLDGPVRNGRSHLGTHEFDGVGVDSISCMMTLGGDMIEKGLCGFVFRVGFRDVALDLAEIT